MSCQRSKTPAPGSAARPIQAPPTLKRQMTGSSVASHSSTDSAPPTFTKRARTDTLPSSSATTSAHILQSSQAANIQRPMYTGISAISSSSFAPVTPCPPSSTHFAAKTHDLMLVPSSAHSFAAPALSTAGKGHPPSSRLPLKTQLTGAMQNSDKRWQLTGITSQSAKGTAPTAQSLFSPHTLSHIYMQPQQSRAKQSFRPRPSILSSGTAASSMSSASTWAVRTASSATSVDSMGSVC